jgi:hypothetical protein
MSMRVILLCLLTLIALAGCSTKRRPDVNVPALAAEKPPVRLGSETEAAVEASAPATEEVRSEEPVVGAERVVVPPLRPATPRDDEPEVAVEPVQEETVASPPSRRTPQLVAPVKTPETTETPLETDPVRTEARPPSLKPMLSDAERRRLDAQIHVYMDRARRNLASIQEGRLEVNERTALQEARSILTRAEQLRQSDPALSSSLAERAAILSQELLRKQR